MRGCDVKRNVLVSSKLVGQWKGSSHPNTPVETMDTMAEEAPGADSIAVRPESQISIKREFTKRHFQARYKVHELIGARLKIEKQKQQSASAQQLTADARRCEGGFFQRLFLRPSRS